MPTSVAVPAAPADASGRRWPRLLLWTLLIMLVLVGQAALWWFARQHENNKAQDAADSAAIDAATEVRQRMMSDIQAAQQLVWSASLPVRWRAEAEALLRDRSEFVRLELRDSQWALQHLVESTYHPAQFDSVPRAHMLLDGQAACARAQRTSVPVFSRSYFMPAGSGLGKEVIDLCLPLQSGVNRGILIATVSLGDLLAVALPVDVTRRYEITWIESDGTRLARLGLRRGAGVYTSVRLVDVAGFTLPLRLNSTATAPDVITNPYTAMVPTLSLALMVVLFLLVHDVRRRAVAERDLGDALAFRNAMEDSLITGLRARNMQGRVTYVNQAFCRMVGYAREELLNNDIPPYWPPELRDSYRQRHAERLGTGQPPSREGLETLFMRRDGERFPVMILEAPLIDMKGRQTGWMGTVLDMGAQRKAEELSRQQQDKLQAAARLATMGEMASLLSHELNQPLAAIASYAHGSLNLLPRPEDGEPVDAETAQMLRQATARIAEQADRAGRVIRSVHQFVRRRERLRENVRASELIEAVLPLVRLAARRSHTQIQTDIPTPSPRVSCDRTMVEQVLLNLSRNGLQAMDALPADASRVLTLRVREADPGWVEFGVIDCGPGIASEVAPQIFTPFFTTKSEGLGIGLAMCRTVVEQHGGALGFDSPVPIGIVAGDDTTAVAGTIFRFTLPAAGAAPHAPPTPDAAPDAAPEPVPETALRPTAAHAAPS